MPVSFQRWIKESDLELNPDVLYVFGDNNERWGKGGLAKECRGKRNAVGVRTKKAPTMDPTAFLSDVEYDQNVEWINQDMIRVLRHLEEGRQVVFPTAPLGSGRAELDKRAPRTFKYIKDLTNQLAEAYG